MGCAASSQAASSPGGQTRSPTAARSREHSGDAMKSVSVDGPLHRSHNRSPSMVSSSLSAAAPSVDHTRLPHGQDRSRSSNQLSPLSNGGPSGLDSEVSNSYLKLNGSKTASEDASSCSVLEQSENATHPLNAELGFEGEQQQPSNKRAPSLLTELGGATGGDRGYNHGMTPISPHSTPGNSDTIPPRTSPTSNPMKVVGHPLHSGGIKKSQKPLFAPQQPAGTSTATILVPAAQNRRHIEDQVSSSDSDDGYNYSSTAEDPTQGHDDDDDSDSEILESSNTGLGAVIAAQEKQQHKKRRSMGSSGNGSSSIFSERYYDEGEHPPLLSPGVVGGQQRAPQTSSDRMNFSFADSGSASPLAGSGHHRRPSANNISIGSSSVDSATALEPNVEKMKVVAVIACPPAVAVGIPAGGGSPAANHQHFFSGTNNGTDGGMTDSNSTGGTGAGISEHSNSQLSYETPLSTDEY